MNQDLEPTLTHQSLPTPVDAPPPNPPPGTRRRSRLRSFFWPGFAAGFLLLGAVSCGGFVFATGLNRIGLNEIQGAAAGWTPPAVTPTSTPSAAALPGPPADGAFAPGDNVRNMTNSRVNIRQTPGHQNKPPTDILAQVEPGAALQIVAGPAPVDNLTWWLIRTQSGDGRTVEGWMAEATQSGVTILGR